MAKVVGPSSRQQEAWRLMLELFFAHRGEAARDRAGVRARAAAGLRAPAPAARRADEALRPAPALHCDNSSVTGIADRLEKAGLAERRPHPTDRRVKTLALTERGKVDPQALQGPHRHRARARSRTSPTTTPRFWWTSCVEIRAAAPKLVGAEPRSSVAAVSEALTRTRLSANGSSRPRATPSSTVVAAS